MTRLILFLSSRGLAQIPCFSKMKTGNTILWTSSESIMLGQYSRVHPGTSVSILSWCCSLILSCGGATRISYVCLYDMLSTKQDSLGSTLTG